MPNWCENCLILKHADKTKLEEALAAFNKDELLNYFVPMPAHIIVPPDHNRGDLNFDPHAVLAERKKLQEKIAAVMEDGIPWGAGDLRYMTYLSKKLSDDDRRKSKAKKVLEI